MDITIPMWAVFTAQIMGGTVITLFVLWIAASVPAKYAGIALLFLLWAARYGPEWFYYSIMLTMIVVITWSITQTSKKPLD